MSKLALQPVALMRLNSVIGVEQVTNKIPPEELVVQKKADGWLVQVINGRVYSRRGKDITEHFPSITDAIRGISQNSHLVGELVWWGEDNKQHENVITSIAVGDRKRVIQKQSEIGGFAQLLLFDILVKDGEDVSDKPLVERIKLLERVVGEGDKYVKVMESYPFEKWQEVMKEALGEGGEGIVLKGKKGTYVYTELDNKEPKAKDWFKYKPEEKSKVDDFVVYELSTTPEGKTLFHFGQYYGDELIPVGQLDNLSKDLETEFKEKFEKEKPFVVELGFQERFKDTGKLRHPRFVRIREDKAVKDATLPDEFVEKLKTVKLPNKTAQEEPEIVFHSSRTKPTMVPVDIRGVRYEYYIDTEDKLDDFKRVLSTAGSYKALNWLIKNSYQTFKKNPNGSWERVAVKLSNKKVGQYVQFKELFDSITTLEQPPPNLEKLTKYIWNADAQEKNEFGEALVDNIIEQADRLYPEDERGVQKVVSSVPFYYDFLLHFMAHSGGIDPVVRSRLLGVMESAGLVTYGKLSNKSQLRDHIICEPCGSDMVWEGEVEIWKCSSCGNVKQLIKQANYPTHPDTVVVKPNEFYPQGLTEKQVWEYYDRNKSEVLESIKDRYAFLVLSVDGKVYKRKEDGFIKIANVSDFDKYNNGRVAEIHLTANDKDNIWWVDIDPKDKVSWEKTKAITREVYDLVQKGFDVDGQVVKPKTINAKYSGGRGFHVWGELPQVYDVNKIRKGLRVVLDKYIEEKGDPKLTTSIARELDMVRLDITTLHDTGSIRASYSLQSDTGLISLPISLEQLSKFEKKDAVIGDIKKGQLYLEPATYQIGAWVTVNYLNRPVKAQIKKFLSPVDAKARGVSTSTGAYEVFIPTQEGIPEQIYVVSHEQVTRQAQLHDKRIAVDFDGVLYDGRDVISGAPEALRKLRDGGWIITIYTAREDEGNVVAFLKQKGIPYDEVYTNTNIIRKPPSQYYIDDHALHFTDWEDALDQIYNGQRKAFVVMGKFKWDPNSTTSQGRWRLVDPHKFESNTIRTWSKWGSVEEPGISFIVGELKVPAVGKKKGEMAVQAIRFEKSHWDEKKAGEWWKKHQKEHFYKEWTEADWGKQERESRFKLAKRAALEEKWTKLIRSVISQSSTPLQIGDKVEVLIGTEGGGGERIGTVVAIDDKHIKVVLDTSGEVVYVVAPTDFRVLPPKPKMEEPPTELRALWEQTAQELYDLEKTLVLQRTEEQTQEIERLQKKVRELASQLGIITHWAQWDTGNPHLHTRVVQNPQINKEEGGEQEEESEKDRGDPKYKDRSYTNKIKRDEEELLGTETSASDLRANYPKVRI